MRPQAGDQGRPLRVGLVEITGFHWTRRPRLEWSTAAGALEKRRDPRAALPGTYHFLPYSVGLLQAYAQKHAAEPDRFEFQLPVYRRLPVQDIVDQLLDADVVGLSVYCWNARLTLAVARRLKEARPRTTIILGGPQVPDQAEGFLRQNPFVDVACHGEGEAAFLALLERLPDGDFGGVPGVSFLGPDGRFATTPRAGRIADLSRMPSPYLEGVFEPLMRAHPEQAWQMLWETNRGCPFSCTFCDWGSAVASKVYPFPMERLQSEIEWMADKKIGFVFCVDANFGILPRDLDLARHVAETRMQRGYPLALGVQNTKNATERAYQVQSLLARMSTTGVTLSLQSTDPATLKAVKRTNISQASFRELQRRYTRDGIDTYTDVILGLPGETYDSYAEGISDIIDNGQHNRIHFYDCSALPNAEMADPEYRRRYGLVTVERRIADAHDSIARPAWEVDEYLDLVVATDAMPREDWIKAKAFSWLAELLYFDRLLQIPFVLLHQLYGVGYRELIELPAAADLRRHPLAAGVHAFFVAKAREAQEGGEEHVPSEQWLGVYWPAPQLALIGLATEWKLEAFYDEMEGLAADLLRRRGIRYDPVALGEAFALNESLLRMPFEVEDLELSLTHNVWELYRAALAGSLVPLESRECRYRIVRTKPVWLSWEDWCEDLIARLNRKSAYLYEIHPAGVELPRPPRDHGAIAIHAFRVAE